MKFFFFLSLLTLLAVPALSGPSTKTKVFSLETARQRRAEKAKAAEPKLTAEEEFDLAEASFQQRLASLSMPELHLVHLLQTRLHTIGAKHGLSVELEHTQFGKDSDLFSLIEDLHRLSTRSALSAASLEVLFARFDIELETILAQTPPRSKTVTVKYYPGGFRPMIGCVDGFELL